MTRAGDWPTALQTALHTDWPYDAFLHWFLERNLLNASRTEFVALLAQHLQQNGIDLPPRWGSGI